MSKLFFFGAFLIGQCWEKMRKKVSTVHGSSVRAGQLVIQENDLATPQVFWFPMHLFLAGDNHYLPGHAIRGT